MKKTSSPTEQPFLGNWISLAIRLLVGGIFLYAGFIKASAPVEEFAAVVEGYGILPPDWAFTFAQIVPWIELIFGMFLIAGYWIRASSRILAGLLAMFIYALASALLHKIPLDNCGCFGSSFHLDPRLGILFDAGLLASAIWLSRKGSDLCSVDRWVQKGRP